MADKPNRSFVEYIIWIILILIFGASTFGVLGYALYEAFTEMQKFDESFVFFKGVGSLMIAAFWVGIIAFLFASLKAQIFQGMTKIKGAILGGILALTLIGSFLLFEEVLTLKYIKLFVNNDQSRYVYCGSFNKTKSRSQFSKIYVFAKTDVGCGPYFSLGLKKLDDRKADKVIENLNRKFR